MEPQLHEIVDLERIDAFIFTLAVIAPFLGLLIGGLWGRKHGAVKAGLVRGLVLGHLGPVVLLLWRMYRHMVRYDPETGYVGLHKMSVLLTNVVLFALVGLLLGLAYGKLLASGRRRGINEAEKCPENQESQC